MPISSMLEGLNLISGKIDENPLIYSAKHTIKAGLDISYKNKFNIYTKVLYRTGSHFITSTFEEPIMNDPFLSINTTGNYILINNENFKANLFFNIYNLFNSKYYNVGANFVFTPQDPFRFDIGIKLYI